MRYITLYRNMGSVLDGFSQLQADVRAPRVLFTRCAGGKIPPAKAGAVGDMGSIPESGRSPGGGHGNPLQYSCLENPMDRGAWWTTQFIASQRVGHH